MRAAGRRLAVPLLVLGLAEAVLLGLGTWQVQRLRWKEGVLARIEASERGPVLELSADPPLYQRVSVTGRFRFDQAVAYGIEGRDMPRGQALGHFQVVPLERAGAPAVLVNRGWVPEGAATVDPAGEVSVTGFVRPATPAGWFSPADSVSERRFFTLDAGAMAGALGLGAVLPFSVTALGEATPGVYPAPAVSLPRPSNNHLSYAVTWYSLAVVLLVIGAVRLRSR
jgi:surfeit locus 1 family protein